MLLSHDYDTAGKMRTSKRHFEKPAYQILHGQSALQRSVELRAFLYGGSLHPNKITMNSLFC